MSALLQELVIPAICTACEEDLTHCHGTAIVHGHGGVECSDDPACRLPEDAHAYVILCVEIDGGCC